MPHDDPSWLPPDSHSAHISAARAQVEAARLRHQRLFPARSDQHTRRSLPGYTLVREIHRGGQGVVYLARQNSTGRDVAVKILDRAPLSGPAGLARFEREVQTLTLLKHPNVVTIHDCGRDLDRPFLVMDYVDGRTLDAYVHREDPPLRDLLTLFARICDGVNAAHLRGVIHRDLKPGNILVDEHAEPRVLDFGLAKLAEEPPLGGSAAPPRGMTQTGQFVGSLPWASPEQAEGRTDQLDIRSDVYSLGVVLFQILTSRFPYPVSGGHTQTVAHIAQTPPTRPSALRRDIDRELDTILLKCLAKDPDRRYQSAGELARDLRRYLAGEAIEARRDSLVYMMGKRIARYRAAAIAAAAVLLAVTIALAVSVTLWRREQHQRTVSQRNAEAAQRAAARADSQADQARAVVEFMRSVLTSVEPERKGADVRLIQVLASASAAASQRFAAHPAREAEVRDLLGQVYDKLSMWNESKAEFTLCAELCARSAGPDDLLTLTARSRQVAALINLVHTGEAEAQLQDLLPRLHRVLGPDDPLTLMARRDAATVALFRGRAEEAESTLLELRIHPRLAEDDAAQVRIISALFAVYNSRFGADDPAQRRAALELAEPLAIEWIERSQRRLGPLSPLTLMARVKHAEICCNLGRFRETDETCRAILDATSDRLGPCHSIRTKVLCLRAEALARLGHDQEPADLFLDAVGCLRQTLAPDSVVYLGVLSDALRYLDRAGRAAEGEACTRELIATLRRLGGGHDDLAQVNSMFLAGFVSAQGRLDEADLLFAPLIAAQERISDPRTRARLHIVYGAHLARRADFESAERELDAAAQALGDITRGTWDSHPDDLIVAYINLYKDWGRPDRAQSYARLRPASRQQ
jgi:non-specific serine/threonine protein kinase/serine/threonine-protein kinase